MPQARNTRIQIDFVVREVCDDGTVPEEDLKYVRFGDEVAHSMVKDFFDRSGEAMGLMFKSTGSHVIAFTSTGPNKISVIKVVRELTGYGLKEAKDVVEAPMGTAVIIVSCADDEREICTRLNLAGASVSTRRLLATDEGPRGTIPALITFQR